MTASPRMGRNRSCRYWTLYITDGGKPACDIARFYEAVSASRARDGQAIENQACNWASQRSYQVHITTGDMALSDSKTTALWSERVLVVLPSDHPLAAREVLYWTDLRDQTICSVIMIQGVNLRIS